MKKSKGALFVKRKPDIYRCKETNYKKSILKMKKVKKMRRP